MFYIVITTMQRFLSIQKQNKKVSPAFFEKLMQDDSLSQSDKKRIKKYYHKNQKGGTPFAKGVNFGDMTGPQISSGVSSPILQTVQSKKCNSGYNDSKIFLGQGAHGCLYMDNTNTYVYKYFDDKFMYNRIKLNIQNILQLLSTFDIDGKTLKNFTCFSNIEDKDIFNDNKMYYKMNKCEIVNCDTEVNKCEDLITKFSSRGFVHGDIKLDNIMSLDGELVLVDIDDMSFFQLERGKIISTNSNEPLMTPLFVNPIYLAVRYLLLHDTNMTSFDIDQFKKYIKPDVINMMKYMYNAEFNAYARINRYIPTNSIFHDILSSFNDIQNIADLFAKLKNSDMHSLTQSYNLQCGTEVFI